MLKLSLFRQGEVRGLSTTYLQQQQQQQLRQQQQGLMQLSSHLLNCRSRLFSPLFVLQWLRL